METDSSKKPPPLVRVHPRYVRIRQGSELRYHVKLLRPPSKSRGGVAIHVCVVNPKCGVSVQPSQLVVSASDWRLPREVVVACELDADLRTIQIYHKIQESYDDVFRPTTIVPSVFVSVLQKEATFLFAFGCGLHGRLGISSSTDADDKAADANANLPTAFASKWLHPVQLACGKAHTAIVDVFSNIYCFGANQSGQLGQGDANLEPSRLPLRVPSVGTATILSVACGANHTLCLAIDGKVFAWGDNACGQLGVGGKWSKPRGTPTRVEKVVNVRALYAGGNQSFLVTTDNNVLASGSNIAGQLGLGDRVDRTTFERLPFFRRLSALAPSSSRDQLANSVVGGDAVELACGSYHTLALVAKRVYVWGNSDDGRLGLGKIKGESVLDPTLVETLPEIRGIACGGSHSGAVATTGDVFTWGSGQYGQTGHGTTRSRRVPTRVRLLQGKGAHHLAFGEWHSMALCEDGTLYAWGFGEEGQLGLPEDMKQKGTRIVPLPAIVSAVSGTGATTVRCGGAHTFVVTVLESRRPQLAKLHRKASRLEIQHEVARLMTLERQRSRKHPLQTVADEREPSDVLAKPPSSNEQAKSLTKASPRRVLPRFSDVRDEDADAVEFRWQERPLSSRLAVRNALKQEMRVVAEMKELLTPRAATPPSTASTSGDSRRVRSANAFVSPRLKRLNAQVVRSSEAGVTRAKTRALLRTAGPIDDEVERATSGLLRSSAAAGSVVCCGHGGTATDALQIGTYPDDSEASEHSLGSDGDEVAVGGMNDLFAMEADIRAN